MRNFFLLPILMIFFLVGCTSEIVMPRDNKDIKNISISVPENKLVVGKETSFVVKEDRGFLLTSVSKIFVNGEEVTGSKYTPKEEGSIEVYATYKTYTSPKISLNVKPKSIVTPPNSGGGNGTVPTSYKTKVLAYDFTGTWCGNCIDGFVEIEEMHKEYPDNFIPVAIHQGSGPDNDGSFDYDNNDVYNVSGIPRLWVNNKYIGDNGYFPTVVSDAVKETADLGLAVNYDLKNDKVTIKVGYVTLLNNTKLVIHMVEDKLIADQANYRNDEPGNPFYQKGNPITNFEHNNVLRTSLTPTLGTPIPSNEILNNLYTVEYTIGDKKGKFKNLSNTKIVAFVLDKNGKALNAQVAKANENKDFD